MNGAPSFCRRYTSAVDKRGLILKKDFILKIITQSNALLQCRFYSFSHWSFRSSANFRYIFSLLRQTWSSERHSVINHTNTASVIICANQTKILQKSSRILFNKPTLVTNFLFSRILTKYSTCSYPIFPSSVSLLLILIDVTHISSKWFSS